ncbi:hypothetical protein [Actinomadura bangladeshensis]|uniref:Uncharacterized protein n=1 Tax=Actinomadura bangladeshensis TaxID=453573 RepID=A0A4V6P9P2_9ACTN|nr:hypothetical protein [Actinomadura bangladeshensis]TDC01206.1 hypothetical protein E1284_40310 [Actinomadura bangladeshensis]
MIILSGVLVVVAIALLVAGIVAGNGDSAQVFGLDALVVIYISIAVSIISALCLAIGVFLRRKELWGSGASVAPARASKRSTKDKRKKAAPPAPAKGAPAAAGVPAPPAPAADTDDDVLEMPAPPADVPDDAMVFVVRGRKRYHLDTCRQLAGRDAEELTYAEAKEEGFSPCTACMPDTALAARAAASVPASSGPGKGPGGLEPAPQAAPTSFDTPGSFDRPASFDKPGSFDEPEPFDRKGGFDRTAEIPRADEPAAPEPPAADPAGPTLTDMPVAGLFGKAAGAAPSAPETADEPEAREREPEARSAWERPAEAESAAPDVTVDLGPASYAGAAYAGTEAPAPKPHHAFDTADDDADDDTAGEDAADVREAGEPGALAAESAADPEPEPSAEGSADHDEPAAEPAGDGPQVRILSGTKRYHRVDCALIEDIGDEADDLESLSRAEAKSRGCTPCLVCQPDRERARD